ncbi:MAG: VOC family protein [Ferruginibacter sp.]
MSQINAYITFNGNCREAMDFYKECLGGELTIQTIAGSPIESECPQEMKNSILHATLMKDNLLLMASEMIGPEGLIHGNNIALSLNCSSEEEINTFFNKLSAGGKVFHELRVEFWGAIFGVFNDKFGIRWMLNYDKKIES